MQYYMGNFENVTPERTKYNKWSFMPRANNGKMSLDKVLDMLWVDYNIRSFPIDFDELKLENDLYDLPVGSMYRVLNSSGSVFMDLKKISNDSFVVLAAYGVDSPVNDRRICSDASATSTDAGFGRTFMGTGGNSYPHSPNRYLDGYREAA